MNNDWTLINFLLFPAIFILFLLFLILLIYFYAKGDKKSSKFIYGYFTGLDKKKTMALSLIVINFYLLSFVLVMKISLSIYVGVISFLLLLIAGILSDKSYNIIVNVFINFVNLSLIYLANIVNVLRLGSDEIIFYILQIMMNFLGILFFLFTSLKFIKNIYKRSKN